MWTPAMWVGAGGIAALVAAVLVFVFRPSGEVSLPAETAAPATAAVSASAALGPLTCSLIPERSRIVTSSTAPVTLDWGANGCADGRDRFQPAGGRWERIEAPAAEQTVTLRSFDPATRTYAATRWFLDADAMAAARQRQGMPAACGADPAAAARQAAATAASRCRCRRCRTRNWSMRAGGPVGRFSSCRDEPGMTRVCYPAAPSRASSARLRSTPQA